MAKITLGGSPVNTLGTLPAVGGMAPNFTLSKTDLSETTLADFKGHKVVMNIFPSIGTGVCATSVRNFNKEAANLENTKVLCISRDLPFAQVGFCAAEGIENVVMLSDFKNHSFGKDYQLEILDSKFAGLLSRCIIVLDETGKIVHTEQVPEIANEPNYEAALKSL
jgi:thiol peroxidase